MTATFDQEGAFSRQLMDWHHRFNHRDLPWKGIRDPYRIWISEILLQQTRAEQAIPYYLRFIEAFPRVEDLARAPDDQVFRLWQGLGYYSRCRNLLKTARILVDRYQGQFPASYPALLSLPGIGPYTAAALSSFAFGLPHAVVDGNVIRLLSRRFGIDEFFDRQPGKSLFQDLAQRLLDPKDPGAYNQAIMDLGADLCRPRHPDCPRCPFRQDCRALAENRISEWPRIRPKPERKIRYFHYVILERQQRRWVRKRKDKDIWAQLYEPLLVEYGSRLLVPGILQEAGIIPGNIHELELLGEYQQILSHQQIRAVVYQGLWKGQKDPPGEGQWLPAEKIRQLGFPQKLAPFMQRADSGPGVSEQEKLLGE